MSDGSFRSKRNPTDITTRDWARDGVDAVVKAYEALFEELFSIPTAPRLSVRPLRIATSAGILAVLGRVDRGFPAGGTIRLVGFR